jgi:hypothetical protein
MKANKKKKGDNACLQGCKRGIFDGGGDCFLIGLTWGMS